MLAFDSSGGEKKINTLRYFSGILMHDFKIQNLGSFFIVVALRGSYEEAYTLNGEPFCGFLYQRWEEIVQGLQLQRCVEIREMLLRTLHIRRIALCNDVTIVFFLFCDAECLLIYIFVLLTQYRAGDKIKKNEMGWACGAYG